LKFIVSIVLIHNDKEEVIMNIGAEKLGQEMHLIGIHMYEWIVHSECVALSNRQPFGILTTSYSFRLVIVE